MYGDLYKAWKAEKTTAKPQQLASDFYQRASGYLKGLEDSSTASDARTIQGSLIVNEKEIVKRLLGELKRTRLEKIVNAAKEGTAMDTDYLTEEERTLVKQFNESLTSYNEREKEKTPSVIPEDITELSLVRFLKDIPEIVGVDLKIYGPYKKEDVGSLPNQNAQALIKQGVAKQIDFKRVSNLAKEKAAPQAHQQ